MLFLKRMKRKRLVSARQDAKKKERAPKRGKEREVKAEQRKGKVRRRTSGGNGGTSRGRRIVVVGEGPEGRRRCHLQYRSGRIERKRGRERDRRDRSLDPVG